MPSPDNHTDQGSSTDFNNAGTNVKLSDFIEEPGEPKALAGGVGPVSFAGSGYGIMLVLTVSNPYYVVVRHETQLIARRYC